MSTGKSTQIRIPLAYLNNPMFNDTPEGTTQFCNECEHILWHGEGTPTGKHSCGVDFKARECCDECNRTLAYCKCEPIGHQTIDFLEATDESWEEWRIKNPKEVDKLKSSLITKKDV